MNKEHQKQNNINNLKFQILRKIIQCDNNLAATRKDKERESPLNPFQEKIFKELEEAYHREKRQLEEQYKQLDGNTSDRKQPSNDENFWRKGWRKW